MGRRDSKEEYRSMCNDMERVAGYDERTELYRKELKRRRSAVLHQMQLLGVNTADWNRVDAYCQDRRIAGKKFRELDCEELDALTVRLRVIRRKKENKENDKFNNLKKRAMAKIDLNGLSPEERKQLLEQLQSEEKQSRQDRREAYEALRAQFMHDVFARVEQIVADVNGFKVWIDGESESFKKLMTEYGQTRYDSQNSHTIADGDLKLEIRCNKVKTFDERADLAAERLIDYLRGYALNSDKGSDDPMYQLAMTLLERNKQGNLDYKSISKLYEMEGKFDEEYTEIMNLFRESNVVQRTALNYYFSKRDKDGVWRRLEPSFCRL